MLKKFIDISAAKWIPESAFLYNPYYVSVAQNETEKSRFHYGGCQNWFPNIIKKCGCGIIAGCDFLLYMIRKHNLTDYADLLTPAIAMDIYMQFVTEHFSAFHFGLSYRLLGTPHRRLVAFLRKFCPVSNMDFGFRRIKSMSKTELQKFICDMLSEDIPVITRVGFKFRKLHADVSDPVKMSVRSCCIDWHYITITRLNFGDNTDNAILTFSTWGEIGHLNFNEFYDNAGFTSGIITCEYTN